MKEFRISLPNEPGQLARVGEALGSRGVNILTVAAFGDVNLVALVVDQEDIAREGLEELGLSFQEAELLTLNVPNRPGELSTFAKKLGDANINIESIYLLEASGEEAKVALTVSDMAKAKQVLGM
ncbi:MAG: ACT domain-containing protein [Candidatus Aminicenantes bacterium]|nr:ACT domain-containing protein [Candidatus Aminicenantes bacterium]